MSREQACGKATSLPHLAQGYLVSYKVHHKLYVREESVAKRCAARKDSFLLSARLEATFANARGGRGVVVCVVVVVFVFRQARITSPEARFSRLAHPHHYE